MEAAQLWGLWQYSIVSCKSNSFRFPLSPSLPLCRMIVHVNSDNRYRSGLTVITTCSPHNFALVRNRGADAAFDFHDQDCGSKIRAYTEGKLKHAFDTIATPSSARICAEALAPPSLEASGTEDEERKRLRYMGSRCLRAFPRDDVEKSHFLWYTALVRHV